MKADQRAVKFFDCRIMASVRVRGGEASQVKAVGIRAVLDEIKAALTAGSEFKIEGVGATQVWRIADAEVDLKRNCGIILINRADKLAADQAIVNAAKQKFRVARKRGDDGNAYSCHVAFKLRETKPSEYLTLVEEVPGISTDKIVRLLSQVRRVASSRGSTTFCYRHPDGSEKLLQGTYRFDLSGHPSIDFIRELNGGALQGIEVVNSAVTKAGWDAFNATVPLAQVVRLKPLKSSATVYNIIKSVCDRAKLEKMDQVRVRFVDSDAQHHSLTFDPDTYRLMNEERYVKREWLNNFTTRLDTGVQTIHPDIRDKMFYLLR